MTRDELIEAMKAAHWKAVTIEETGRELPLSKAPPQVRKTEDIAMRAVLAAIEAQGLVVVDAEKLEIVLDEAESNNRLGEGEFCYSDGCREICRLERVRIDEIRAMINAGRL